MEPANSGRFSALARWRTPLQVLFALAALAFVFTTIPWRDQALHTAADGARTSMEGKILGDWKSASVRFQPDAAVGANLPEVFARAARAADGSIELARDDRIDWRPGMPRVFREMDTRGLALALACFAAGQLLVVTRWARLLRTAGCPVSWFESLRLTCLGLFFNLVVPGLTGGDLVKALLAARSHPDRREAALVSVAFDRLLGLWCMILLAAAAVMLAGDTFQAIRWPVLGAAAAASIGALALLSRTLRRWLAIERLLERLPMSGVLRRIDSAVTTYASARMELALCTALSFLNHLVVIGGILVLGKSFGDDVLHWTRYFAIAPVATIVSALPVAPGGWGVGEAAYSYLFSLLGASAAIGLATSISFRLLQMSLSLAAGLFLFAPGSARMADMKHLSAQPRRES